MSSDYAVAYGQAKSCALARWFGRVERVKDLLDIGIKNATASIGNRNRHVVVLS